jgi:hypothetical protein
VRGTLGRVEGGLVVTETKTEKSRRPYRCPYAPPAFCATFDSGKCKRARGRLQVGQNAIRFHTEFGQPCEPRNALRALKVAADRAKLAGVGLHTLRHSAASVMLSNGVPPKVVSDVLGHASMAITGDVYGHIAPTCHAARSTPSRRLSVRNCCQNGCQRAKPAALGDSRRMGLSPGVLPRWEQQDSNL